MANIKLIGVFAHRTKGFAVMLVDEKQVGVALGEEVRPGIRLAETHADHVVLEQGGARRRVDMTGTAAPTGVSGPPPAGAAGSAPATPGGAQGQIDALQRQLNMAGNLPPEQSEALKRQLENMRGPH